MWFCTFTLWAVASFWIHKEGTDNCVLCMCYWRLKPTSCTCHEDAPHSPYCVFVTFSNYMVKVLRLFPSIQCWWSLHYFTRAGDLALKHQTCGSSLWEEGLIYGSTDGKEAFQFNSKHIQTNFTAKSVDHAWQLPHLNASWVSWHCWWLKGVGPSIHFSSNDVANLWCIPLPHIR